MHTINNLLQNILCIWTKARQRLKILEVKTQSHVRSISSLGFMTNESSDCVLFDQLFPKLDISHTYRYGCACEDVSFP